MAGAIEPAVAGSDDDGDQPVRVPGLSLLEAPPSSPASHLSCSRWYIHEEIFEAYASFPREPRSLHEALYFT
jgi:hypothetical protein